MKRIIGVDIDGVITKEGKGKDNIWYKYLCDYLGENIERKNDIYDFTEAFDISEETVKNFLNEHLREIYWNIKPAPGAKKTLIRLKKLDFRIILITARKDKFHPLTVNWLKKYRLPYNNLIHEDNKAPLAQKMKIELFIEDNKKNAEELITANIPVILVNKYHNQGLKDKNIYRADNWHEINKYIRNFFDLDKQAENIC